VGIATKLLFVSLLLLLTFCEANRERILAQEVEPGILVEIRPPNYIKELGRTYGYKNAVGLSFYHTEPCRIIVPELTTQTIRLWQHEIRHCRDGSFHK